MNRIQERGEMWFVASAIALLAATAVVKLVSSAGAAGTLNAQEPLTLLSYRWFYRATALLELAVVCGCLATSRREIRLGAIGGFVLGCLAFHGLHWALGLHGPCPCLGRAEEWWPWLAAHRETVVAAVLVYLGSGAGMLLAARAVEGAWRSPSPVVR